MGFRSGGGRYQAAPRTDRLLGDHGIFRHQGGDTECDGFRRQLARRQGWFLQRHQGRGDAPGAEFVDHPGQGVDHVLPGCGQVVYPAVFGDQVAGQVRVGKEADRRLGAGDDQVPDTRQRFDNRFREVRQTLDAGAPGAAGDARGKRMGKDPGIYVIADHARQPGALLQQGMITQQQRRRLPCAQRLCHVFHHLICHPGTAGYGGFSTGLGGTGVPGTVCRDDQGRDMPRRLHGGGDCVHSVRRYVRSRLAFPDPGGNRFCIGGHVRGQRRVVLFMAGGMVPDNVDDGRTGAHGVVQICQAVGQAGTKMEQRRRQVLGHPGVTVRGAGCHTLCQAQHAAHVGHPVRSGDKLHLRGARVGKAGGDFVVDQRS